jgi:hypothetical protein
LGVIELKGERLTIDELEITPAKKLPWDIRKHSRFRKRPGCHGVCPRVPHVL